MPALSTHSQHGNVERRRSESDAEGIGVCSSAQAATLCHEGADVESFSSGERWMTNTTASCFFVIHHNLRCGSERDAALHSSRSAKRTIHHFMPNVSKATKAYRQNADLGSFYQRNVEKLMQAVSMPA